MKIGTQLFLLRSLYNSDKESLFEAINKVAEIGYDGIEFHDYCSATSSEIREIMEKANITAINSHVFYSKWMEDIDKQIEFAKEAGIKNLTFAWLPPELRNEKGYGWLLDNLPIIAQKCQSEGIGFYYHNHDFEFKTSDGKYILDLIMESSNLIKLQLDTFWSNYAGVDTLGLLEKYKERIGLLHIKDYSTLKPNIQFCPIGAGKMNNLEFIDYVKKAGKEWISIDLDNSDRDLYGTLKMSLSYLKSLI